MKRIIILSLAAIAILAGIAYRLYSNQEEVSEAVEKEKNPIPFRIEAIASVEKQFTESNIYRGQIQPFKTIQISTEAHGRVTKVNFKKGEKVAKNQVLIQLDATILQANVAIQKANIAKLKKDADRLQALFEEKNASAQELENVQIQLTTAIEQLKIAEKELANTFSLAPINAFASEKYVNEGEVLQSGSAVATLVDVSSVLAKIYLTEIDALHLKIGNSIKVKTKTYPNHVFVGKIENIIPIATEAKLYPAE
ncbi:MAG: efflux RND transporter periplasmic adaptor subunit, partial [Cytophagales bacterium]|nr:efflux RND transporter periplasmic adaptor subunit [Cytophagales bacterium]